MTAPKPYYEDEWVTLYNGKAADVLPHLGEVDACVTDPPYGQTSLSWDKWPSGWVDLIAAHTSSMWCFGTFRMFLDRWDEFTDWKMSQDVIWDKVISSSAVTDRFRRRHELAVHFYRGAWGDIHHALPKIAGGVNYRGGRKSPGKEPETERIYGGLKDGTGIRRGDGTRYLHSIVTAKRDDHRGRINQTQKATAILEPLIKYAVPPSGVVLDPFAGSGSTAVAARSLGRRSVLIELREDQCEAAAIRLTSELDFTTGATS